MQYFFRLSPCLKIFIVQTLIISINLTGVVIEASLFCVTQDGVDHAEGLELAMGLLIPRALVRVLVFNRERRAQAQLVGAGSLGGLSPTHVFSCEFEVRLPYFSCGGASLDPEDIIQGPRRSKHGLDVLLRPPHPLKQEEVLGGIFLNLLPLALPKIALGFPLTLTQLSCFDAYCTMILKIGAIQ